MLEVNHAKKGKFYKGNPYLCVCKAVNALVSLHNCAGSSEPSLVAFGCDARKPVFGVFEQIRLEPACSATETICS